MRAQVTLRNTGDRPALETVQVYVRDTVTSRDAGPTRSSRRTARSTSRPGERRRVDLELPVADCTLVDAGGRRIVEPGEFELLVGPSSRDEVLLRAGFVVRD